MPRRPGGQHAIHHVYSDIRIFHNFLGRANPHQIPRLICREVLQSRFDDFTGLGARLAHAEPTNSIAVKADPNRSFGGFFSKREVHSTLKNAEESLRHLSSFGGSSCGDGRPRPSCRAMLGIGRRAGLARPDEGVRAYMIRVPWHLPLMLLKILLAAFR